MDREIIRKAIEVGRDVLVVLVLLLAFVIAGTLDHPEEVRHEQWLSELESSGTVVLR
jgi:hypothetical protein